MTNEMVKSAPAPPAVVTPDDWTMFKNMANAAATASIMTAFGKNPSDSMIVLLSAHAMGIHPAVALMKGFVVKGKLDFPVEIKLGLVLSRRSDFEYDIIEHTDKKCVIEGGFAGRKRVRGEFTVEQAMKAGLDGYDGAYAKDKLLWRALVRVLRQAAPHIMWNMSTVLSEDDAESPRSTPSESSGPLEGPSPSQVFAAMVARIKELGKGAGLASPSALNGHVNQILRVGGKPPVKNAHMLSPDDAEFVLAEMEKRYGKNGGATAGQEAAKPGQSPEPSALPKSEATVVEEEKPTPEQDAAWEDQALVATSSPPAPTPRPAAPPPPADLDPKAERAALVEVCRVKQKVTGFTLVQADEAQGVTWFMDEEILKELGLCGADGVAVPQPIEHAAVQVVRAIAAQVAALGGGVAS